LITGGLRSIIDKTIIRQASKYLITGITAAAAEYLLVYILTELGGFWYIASNTAALTAGFWISFLLNRYWSFKSGGRITRQLALYFMLFVFNLGFSNLVVWLLTEKAGMHYLLSKAAAMAIIVMWNFAILRKVIYKT